MNIYIAPATLVIIAVILCNCIISFSKNKILTKCYLIVSSIFSLVGIVWILLIRSRFNYLLNKQGNSRNFELDFITWAVEKFDAFAIPSIVINSILILGHLFYLLFNKGRGGLVWENTTGFVVSIMILNFLTSIWYGFETINKIFDVAKFITQIAIAEFFVLHIPLIVKRMLRSKYNID